MSVLHPLPLLPQRLQEEAQWLLVVEYVRALLHKRTSCRSAGERLQLAQRIGHDDQQLRELFTGLVGEQSHSGSLVLLCCDVWNVRHVISAN